MKLITENIKIKRGQIWKSKDSGLIIKICQKWRGNKYWCVKAINRKDTTHHIHEGTLIKYYEIMEI